ncbi:DDE_4 domain-containing protein [Cephalotus follicularis]|uniref:DDE_4 domain-containing protein n=1 Tax=Cephalotus follicularis TaxID=3775 RepID=A0A1Q3B073_CEPFO|nr:DDE_4 domain-containing protein [Cephalotus follicularis]
MDETFSIMLSNLLHLHSSLDPAASLLSSPTTTANSPSSSTTSPSSLLSSTSAAPLLFLTLSSLLSSLSIPHPTLKKRKKPIPNSSPSPPTPQNSAYSVAAFRALSTEHIWSLEAPLRDAQWRSLYGLSYPVFTTVVDKLKPFIAASNLSLPSDYAVAMVLSRLTHGFSAKALASRLVEITQAFEEITSLPNVCGAIDGSHIKLHRLNIDRNYVNLYKCKYGYDSVLLQVVADHKKMFWDVCIKAPGGADDASHFRDSLLYNRLTSGDIVWDKVINVRGHHVRPYLLGDWCYPLLSFLMTPFSPDGLGTPAQNLFDGMLMKGRSVVVEALGLLKGRWKILEDLNVGISHAPQTIVACCVLHNLCQIAREPEPELWKEPDEGGTPARVLDNEKQFFYFGESLRQALTDDLHHRLSSR